MNTTPGAEMPQEVLLWDLERSLREFYTGNKDSKGSGYPHRAIKQYAQQQKDKTSDLQSKEGKGMPDALIDLSGLPEPERTEFVDGFMQIQAKHFLQVYIMLGLKKGMETIVYNDPTNDIFRMAFVKINDESSDPSKEIESLLAENNQLREEMEAIKIQLEMLQMNMRGTGMGLHDDNADAFR